MDDCSEKMKDFLAYVAGEETKEELSDRLREEVKRSKSEEKWRAEYMLYLDNLLIGFVATKIRSRIYTLDNV